MKRSTINTPFGTVSILWITRDDRPIIMRIVLPCPGMSFEDHVSKFYPHLRFSSCREIDDTARQINGFLEGEEIEFTLESVELSLCREFQQRVLRAEHQIPRGRISTYGLIAKFLGKSRGARAVGRALATNPFPIIIPCHRAVRSDRYLGGFQGGAAMKRVLLENEGIDFDDEGRVISTIFTYQNNR